MQKDNEINKIHKIICELKQWLLYSGIQNIGNDITRGSIRFYYNIETDCYSFAYSEITGYAITCFLYLNRFEPDPILIERAELAAEYIAELAEKNIKGAIDDRFFYESKTFRPWLFSFDNGICLNGIVNIYRHTKDKKYLETAKNIAKWLIENMQKSDGSFYAAYDYKQEKFIEDLLVWSLHSGPYHAKIAIGLLNLYELTQNNILKESALKICNWILKTQRNDGRFITFQLREDTQIHPHLYAAEALLYAGLKLKNKQFVESSRRATEWILSLQLPNGAFPRQFINGKAIDEESVYELIQTLRLWLLHNLFTDYKFKKGDLNKGLKRLLDYQCQTGTEKMKYGLYFQLKGTEPTLPHINGGAPLAAVQTLIMYYQKLLNKFDFDLNLFI